MDPGRRIADYLRLAGLESLSARVADVERAARDLVDAMGEKVDVGDGSIRRIEVLRVPRQAQDTVKIATDAVHRAAPFGDVSRLPRPWKFVETFLFADDRRFKPRTLDH